MNYITEELEKTLYNHYSERHPIMVACVRQLLMQGESVGAIKKKTEEVIGKNKTSNNLSFVVDYINKQLKN
jgi:uncharacterized protein with HEPN domain